MTTVLANAQVSPSGEHGPDASEGIVESAIWNVRQRTYNSIGNPNFQVDQRYCGELYSNVPDNTVILDRWRIYKNGTMAMWSQQLSDPVYVPGSNYMITNKILRLTVTTAQPSLAAANNVNLTQLIEGPNLRPLKDDVTSISLLARSSVADLTFAVTINDYDYTTINQCLTHMVALGPANTWTLVTLPSLLRMPSSGGNWLTDPSSIGYSINICLASGTNWINPTPGAWWNGNKIGVSGMSNFFASSVGSTFDLAYVQHEPGKDCSALIDLPFAKNLDKCQRYYQKTYSYDVKPGTSGSAGIVTIYAYSGWQDMYQGHTFVKRMARVPTVTPYNWAVAGASGGARGWPSNRNYTLYMGAIGDVGYATTHLNPGAVSDMIGWHYTANTFW